MSIEGAAAEAARIIVGGLDAESMRAASARLAKVGDDLEQIVRARPMVKLNIGCFTTMFPDWRNSDILPLQDWAREHGFPFSQWSIEDPKGIPYDDGVVDLIFCMHTLEHVTYDAGAAFLRECHRVMKPGAVIRLLVPDTQSLCGRYLDGTIGEFDKFSDTAAKRPHAAQKLWEVLAEGGHRAFYDLATLAAALQDAGFSKVARAEFGKSRSSVMQAETKDLYPGLSLIVEATRSPREACYHPVTGKITG